MAHPAADRDRDLVEILFEMVVAVLVVLVAVPILVVAAAVDAVIERQHWPRWPFVIAGAGATTGAVAAGAAHAYEATWLDVWHHVVHHHLPVWRHLLGLVPLALTSGHAAGPVLRFVHDHWRDDAATRHRRDQRSRRRARGRSERVATATSWPVPADRTVLGVRQEGAMPGWTIPFRGRTVVAPLLRAWERQAVIVGETGSGKTVTALALAVECLRAGWDVHWIDGKADPSTARSFVAAGRAIGVEVRDGFASTVDGWRGDGDAVTNRLLSTQYFSEAYYEGIARTVLRLAIGQDPPRSFRELLGRMDRRILARRADGDGYLMDLLKQVPERELAGARARYDGIGWAVGDSLDGTWSYEDVRASYVPVGRPANRNQAAEIGAFILEDLLHWAMERKPPGRRALLVVDEFSKLSHRPDAAADLVERVRSWGVAVVLIGQTWASLGPDEAVRSRLAGTVGTIVVHQLKQPDEVCALAGTEWTLERTEQVLVGDHTGLGSQRAGNKYVVHPDEVRGLRAGEAYLIHGGRALRVRVRPVASPG